MSNFLAEFVYVACVYSRGLKLAAHGPIVARRMIIFGPSLRIKMKIFESIGMFLSKFFLRKA